MDKRVNSTHSIQRAVPFRTKYFRDERLLMVKASPRMEIYIGREYNAFRLFVDGKYSTLLYKDKGDGLYHVDDAFCKWYEDYGNINAADFLEGVELALVFEKPLLQNFVTDVFITRKGELMEIAVGFDAINHPDFIRHEFLRLLKSMMLRCTLYGLTVHDKEVELENEFAIFYETKPIAGTVGTMVEATVNKIQLLMNESG